jgi:hypothetical protein
MPENPLLKEKPSLPTTQRAIMAQVTGHVSNIIFSWFIA